ncbi:MAG TPA: OstA-like protein [Bacteroidota bacterium]|nr:OstA-like protein [Bacteroidota bacterium]
MTFPRIILAGCLTLCAAGLLAQERVIELKSANELRGREIAGEEVRELIGNVHFVQPTSGGGLVKVWCQRALRYMKQNKVELFGNVRIVRDSVTLRAEEGVYYGKEQRARLDRGVQLQRGGRILNAAVGDYFTQEKRAEFAGSVVVQDSVSETRCDRLTYFEEDDCSIATGNVKIISPQNNTTVFGDSLVHFEKQGYTIVPKNPLFMQVDTTSTGIVDTLLIQSRVMEAFQDTSRRFIASEEVVVVRSDVAARCQRATYLTRDERIILQGEPVVWHAERQITGDSIVVGLRDRRLNSVYVEGRAMAVSRADTLRPHRFDQLTGRIIRMYFEDDELRRVEVDRTATSLYYLYDGDRPNGANRSSGDKIFIDFRDRKVDRIKIIGGVEGRYFPEEMLARREREFNLDGFQWRTDRPRRQHLEIVSSLHE